MFFSAVSVSELSIYITGGIFHFGAKQVLAADVDLAKAEDIKTAIKLLAQVSSFSLCLCACTCLSSKSISESMFISISIYLSIYLYACVCMCVCVCVRVCVCVCRL